MGFLPILGKFEQYEILISPESAVDSEWNGVIDFVVSCLVLKLFTCRYHKNPAINGLNWYVHEYLTLIYLTLVSSASSVLVLEVQLAQAF